MTMLLNRSITESGKLLYNHEDWPICITFFNSLKQQMKANLIKKSFKMNGKTVEKAQLPTLEFRAANHIGWFKIP